MRPIGSGCSVSGAGDVNGDGVDDLIIGAPLPPNGSVQSGQSYVVFGRPSDSAPWPSFAALRALGDTNGDGTPEIAVVFRRDGKTIAKVKDAANGGLISRFTFSADLPPVDVEVMDGFGLAPSLVLLGKIGDGAETRDALTGDLLGSVAFNPKFAPVDLTVLPDQDGNGIPELGMLGQGLDPGRDPGRGHRRAGQQPLVRRRASSPSRSSRCRTSTATAAPRSARCSPSPTRPTGWSSRTA